jgi:drug/metabolite transporter (DMT)-like permease
MRPALRLTPLLVACLAATWLIWGSTYLAIRFALESFPPFFQIGSRFACAGVLLLAAVRAVRGTPFPGPRQWLHALIVGTLMLALGTGGCAFAEKTVGSGLVVTFVAVVPLIVSALQRLYGVPVRRLELAAMCSGLAGVLLLARGAGFSSSPQAFLALVIAVSGWSLGSVLSQRRFPLAPGAMGYASQMLCGGLVLLVLSRVTGEQPHWPPTFASVAAWGYLLTAGSLVAFSAYMVLLSRVPSSLATSYSFVNPVVGVLLGVLLGGETIVPVEWAAVACILAGVALLLLQRARSTTAA